MAEYDEFDALAVDASKLHIGKANTDLTADKLLAKGAGQRKAAILASLAAIDADDDERNDTYDATDVGGTVDNTIDADRDMVGNKDWDLILYQAYTLDKSVFGRDPNTRRSLARTRLKQETGWTDEALEGWAVMIGRDSGRLQALARRSRDSWRGEQRTLERTSWQRSEEHDGSQEEDGYRGESSSRGQSGRGRGFGRGSRGGVGFVAQNGNTAGPADDKTTQRARQRKEVRGSHNRRAGRAKKMARGMS